MRVSWAVAAALWAGAEAGTAWADGSQAGIPSLAPPTPAQATASGAFVAGPAARWTLRAAPPEDGQPPEGPRTTPPVEVTGRRPVPPPPAVPEPFVGPTESAPFGPYGAPEWVTQRRWSTVRAYVLPQGQVEFESWWRGRYYGDGADSKHRFQEEIGIGLGGRFQLDLYGNVEKEGDADAEYAATQVEVRYALANWDCLWGNPTLYGEYKFGANDRSDVWEAKLLLADDFCASPCWHWGVNLFYERQIEDEEEIEWGVSGAVSRSIIDQRLALGVEAKVQRTTAKGSRDDPEIACVIGPSLQIRFDDDTHLDIAPLFGVTDDAPDLELYVVFGIALGGGSGSGAWGGPSSTRSR
jgi:hypothetical protein